jgi:hypothetical protein
MSSDQKRNSEIERTAAEVEQALHLLLLLFIMLASRDLRKPGVRLCFADEGSGPRANRIIKKIISSAIMEQRQG